MRFSKDWRSKVGKISSMNEFCSEYRLSKSVVYNRTSQRTIPHLKIAQRIYFSRKAIKEWLQGMEIEAESLN